MNKHLFNIAALLCLTFHPQIATSQDHGKDFFDKNFAESPLQSDSGEARPAKAPAKPGSSVKAPNGSPLPTQKDNKDNSDSFWSSEEDSSQQSKEKLPDPSSIMAEGDGVKIKSLGVIIAGDAVPAAKLAVKEWREVVDRYSLPPGMILLIGDEEKILPDLISENFPTITYSLVGLSQQDIQTITNSVNKEMPLPTELENRLGSAMRTDSNSASKAASFKKLWSHLNIQKTLPPEFATLKKSPSWLIGTAKGVYIMEGFASPRRFINSKGDFVSPE